MSIQSLQKDVASHRQELGDLQKLASTSLESTKLGRPKQDVVVVRNLVSSVVKRFERLQQRVLERGRQLELGHREAKAFAEANSSLLDWIVSASATLDDDEHSAVGTNPEMIAEQIKLHKDFHRSLGNKQSGLFNPLESFMLCIYATWHCDHFKCFQDAIDTLENCLTKFSFFHLTVCNNCNTLSLHCV